MKFTDLFIRRPVLAIVVNLVILIAGLQAVPLAQRPAVPGQPERRDHRHDRVRGRERRAVRGFITTPLERVIAAADGIDYIESESKQSLSTIRARLKLNYDATRGARRDHLQGRPGPRRPPARGRGPDPQRRVGGQPVRLGVPELLLRLPEAERDHRLPRARRPAPALGDRGRAARRHPRRAHVRDAGLAQARSHGCAQRQPGAGPPGARGEQLPRGGRPDEGLARAGEPHRQHRSAAP